MKTILILGGTGVLGSEIAQKIQNTDHRPRIMSRRPAPADLPLNTAWAQADLATGSGLDAAVNGADIIVNCATSPYRDTHQTDVLGLQHITELAKTAGVEHLLHISIVGTDHIPLTYYRQKVMTEEIVSASGVPYTISRITQFHTLLDQLFTLLTSRRWLPMIPLPRQAYAQTIAPTDAAALLLPHILAPPAGRIPDIGGPEILSFEDMIAQWATVTGKHRPIWQLPVLGKLGQALRDGVNTVPENRAGTLTWQDYLQRRYSD